MGANGAPWSVSICTESTGGFIWGSKVEACVNFDDKGMTYSHSEKAGWFAGLDLSGSAVFRINGGTSADKVGGPVGSWTTSSGAEAGLGPHGGVEFETPFPATTKEGSLSLEIGGGVGFEFWSHMQIKDFWNSGYDSGGGLRW
jgi:hypothetical protein